MQNFDFSAHRGSFSEVKAAGPTRTRSKNPELQKRNRLISFTLAALVLVFAMGLYAGIRIGTVQTIEDPECVVRYPNGTHQKTSPPASGGTVSDPASPTTSNTAASQSLANAGSSRTWIIKVGDFDQPTARKLASQLATLPEIRQLQAAKCKGVRESDPDRLPVFRMQSSQNADQENVLIGCFQTAARANHILASVRKSGLPGSSRATLYEY
ncbi:MAG: hypothetical protein KDK39_02425 [Leptospiraceae bacterium]|nr:hypothetical protein [Leptospiraceae bacterium]